MTVMMVVLAVMSASHWTLARSHSAKRPANRAPGSPAIWRHQASPSYRWGKQESMALVSLSKVTLQESGRAGVCRVYPYWVTVSHETHVISHRHICTLCVLPPQWEPVLWRQPACAPRSEGWAGGWGEAESEEEWKRNPPSGPQLKEEIRSYLKPSILRLPSASSVTWTETYL